VASLDIVKGRETNQIQKRLLGKLLRGDAWRLERHSENSDVAVYVGLREGAEGKAKSLGGNKRNVGRSGNAGRLTGLQK